MHSLLVLQDLWQYLLRTLTTIYDSSLLSSIILTSAEHSENSVYLIVEYLGYGVNHIYSCWCSKLNSRYSKSAGKNTVYRALNQSKQKQDTSLVYIAQHFELCILLITLLIKLKPYLMQTFFVLVFFFKSRIFANKTFTTRLPLDIQFRHL